MRALAAASMSSSNTCSSGDAMMSPMEPQLINKGGRVVIFTRLTLLILGLFSELTKEKVTRNTKDTSCNIFTINSRILILPDFHLNRKHFLAVVVGSEDLYHLLLCLRYLLGLYLTRSLLGPSRYVR